MKFSYKPAKSHFLITFATAVIALAVAKCINPHLGMPGGPKEATAEAFKPQATGTDTIAEASRHADSLLLTKRQPLRLVDAKGRPVKNRVTSVVRFETSFPDLNDVQLATARRLGVERIADRAEAKRRMNELVYIADSPFYHVETLHHSIPYLVPRAATLLNAIARAFCDSLCTKGYPLHKLLVTSVLRTEDDVAQLRRRNHNASPNSCHQ